MQPFPIRSHQHEHGTGAAQLDRTLERARRARRIHHDVVLAVGGRRTETLARGNLGGMTRCHSHLGAGRPSHHGGAESDVPAADHGDTLAAL